MPPGVTHTVRVACVRELKALVAPSKTQGVLVRGRAGLVINQLSVDTKGVFSTR